MKRWLPYPVMACALLAVWLLLARHVVPGTILLGVLLAFGLARAFGRLQPPALQMHRAGLLVRLLGRVIVDITRSNLAVARLIMLRGEAPASGFVSIPLTLDNPYGLAMLACIITATPGTIWVSHDSARRVLVIHVLDLADETTWAGSIKRRYESPLLEIFR